MGWFVLRDSAALRNEKSAADWVLWVRGKLQAGAGRYRENPPGRVSNRGEVQRGVKERIWRGPGGGFYQAQKQETEGGGRTPDRELFSLEKT